MLSSLKGVIEELKMENKYGALSMTLNNVKEEDWENNWKKYFKPLVIGDKFLIKPSWEKVDNTENRKVLEIDPGMSFGTGTHETTRLCLETMEKCNLSGKNVLDLGCGSGILSIGALLLGAEHVNMVDIDANSVRIAGENTSLNGFDKDKYDVFCGNIIEDEDLRGKLGFKKYDVIFANIVADVLKAMSGYFGDFLKDNGTLIVSGIIVERKQEVEDAIVQKGFKVIENFSEGSWASIMLEKL
jgi:ribosomal protein L11 methyltransferase